MKLSPSLKLLKVIADENRLKILVLLKDAEFTVGEMVQILDLHQSNISRHLNQLRESELLQDRREGTLVFNRWSDKLRTSPEIKAILESTWAGLPGIEALELKIQDTLNARRGKTQEFFDELAGDYHNLVAPGGGLEALLRGLAWCIKSKNVIDVGCGEGDLSLLLARSCEKVTAIDISPKMLEHVQAQAKIQNLSNITASIGDVDQLPVNDLSADLVFMSQVLHHSAQPSLALQELSRVLAPNGRFIIIDMLKHDQEWMREKLGDLWLGFEAEEICKLLTEQNFIDIKLEQMSIENGLPLFLITGQKK